MAKTSLGAFTKFMGQFLQCWVESMHPFFSSLGPKLTFYERCCSGHIVAYKCQPAPESRYFTSHSGTPWSGSEYANACHVSQKILKASSGYDSEARNELSNWKKTSFGHQDHVSIMPRSRDITYRFPGTPGYSGGGGLEHSRMLPGLQ